MMSNRNDTQMFLEARDAAEVVARQIERNSESLMRIGNKLRSIDPGLVITCGRGSSDHAATYAKYLIESRTGLFTASAAPSINSVYAARMRFENSVCLVISQSGESPDILAVAQAAKAGGAYVIAIVNVVDSPLASIAHEVIEICAGTEKSVAATKSFIGSLSSIVQLVGAWHSDRELDDGVRSLPMLLHKAWQVEWPAAVTTLQSATNMLVLGRGLGLGIAQEAALKLKEVSRMHAEAFSSAELLHGPVAITRPGFPVLAFSQNDATRPGVEKLIDTLVDRGVSTLTAGVERPGSVPLTTCSAHPVIEPLLFAQSFYRMANALSISRGLNPDQPQYLKKVTATV